MAQYLDTDELFAITQQGLDFFGEFFDYAYAFGKYDQIFVPEFNHGAMENVGAVTFNESMVYRDPPTENQRRRRAEVILHEMAHMWFGNLVTMRWWNDLWLNESFATYMSFLAMEGATRFQSGWQDFNNGIKNWAYRQDQLITTHPIAGTVRDTDETFLNFDGITYGKGRVGTEAAGGDDRDRRLPRGDAALLPHVRLRQRLAARLPRGTGGGERPRTGRVVGALAGDVLAEHHPGGVGERRRTYHAARTEPDRARGLPHHPSAHARDGPAHGRRRRHRRRGRARRSGGGAHGDRGGARAPAPRARVPEFQRPRLRQDRPRRRVNRLGAGEHRARRRRPAASAGSGRRSGAWCATSN